MEVYFYIYLYKSKRSWQNIRQKNFGFDALKIFLHVSNMGSQRFLDTDPLLARMLEREIFGIHACLCPLPLLLLFFTVRALDGHYGGYRG